MQHKNPENFKLLEDFIDRYVEENHRSPSNKEMAEGTGLSTATVSRYLSFMRTEGMLDYDGIRNITTRKQSKFKEASSVVPVLGAVSCGLPKFAEENIEEYVSLPVSLFGKGDFFILKANGDSMIGANIDDGDLVLIRQQNTAELGQIVVACKDDEATLKRLKTGQHSKEKVLHAENEAYPDIPFEGYIIQGIAVKVLKDLTL